MEGIISVILLLLLGSILIGTTSSLCGCGGGQITDSVNNCRNIIQAIHIYASDHDGAYPDSRHPGAKDSNTVFRELVIDDKVDTEKMFGCQVSRFRPDGVMGSAPDYSNALEPGENHWAMTRGLNEGAPGTIPLVFENPVQATWPPRWNADAAGRTVKGRTWSGGRVIIGLNDGSVNMMKLSSAKGAAVTFAEDKNPFDTMTEGANAPTFEVLDIAVEEP